MTPTPATGTPTADSGPSTDRRFFGHPLALGSLFSVELWERFSFYGMQTVMAYYLYYAVTEGGLGFLEASAAAIVLGLILSALSPWIRRAMRGVR